MAPEAFSLRRMAVTAFGPSLLFGLGALTGFGSGLTGVGGPHGEIGATPPNHQKGL